jgi:CRISPR-associated endonuclease/helicase Cas3
MFHEYYKRVLSLYNFQYERPYLSHIVETLENNWDKKNVFIIEAPTGYGKSTITATLALKTFEEGRKLIVAFPLRTLLEDQYKKISMIIRDKATIGKKYMHEYDSLYLIKPITLTTVDTLSLTMFGLAPEDLNTIIKSWHEWTGTLQGSSGHYLFSWSSVILSDIVLDEVHLLPPPPPTQTFLASLFKHAVNYDQKIVLMSATLPDAFKKKIYQDLYGLRDKILLLNFEEDADFIGSRKEKTYDVRLECLSDANKYERLLSWVEDALMCGLNRALIIFNTVRDAIGFYELYTSKNGTDHVILIHSRFCEMDRRRKVERLNQLKFSRRYVVIATQAVEAGIDMSSDVLISELAPANSLVQRFGRFLRYDDEKSGCAYIWYEGQLAGERYKVYDGELCRKTLEYLEKNHKRLNFHIPNTNEGYAKLINYVYGLEHFSIDKKWVDILLSTFTDFDNIANAVNKFLELEGSFVRDAEIIPVSPPSMSEIIPISYSLFNHLLKNGLVTSVILTDNTEKEIDVSRLKDFKTTFRYIIKENVASFRVNCRYDPEIGLLIEDSANE